MPFVGIGVGRQRFPKSEGGFDADYQAVLDYATTQGYTLPSASQQTLQNQLVLDLKDGGIWSKLDTFGVFATDGDSDFALIDWIRLTDYTAINSPTFTINKGFQGDGVSTYIDPSYIASIDGVNYTSNNGSIGVYISTISTSVAMSYFGESRYNTSMREGASDYYQGASLGITPSTNNTLAYYTNDNSGNSLQITNTTDVATSTNIGTITSNDITILSEEGLIAFSNAEISIFFIGSKIYSEKIAFYNALNNYITSL